MSGDIYLNIDTIVLRGLNQVDRQALENALRESLQEQLSTHSGVTSMDLPRVKTTMALSPSSTSEQLGRILGKGLSEAITDPHPARRSATNTYPGGRRHD